MGDMEARCSAPEGLWECSVLNVRVEGQGCLHCGVL